MKTIILVALLLAACNVQSERSDIRVLDNSNGNLLMKEFVSQSGAYCIAVFAPGHAAALQCDFNNVKPANEKGGSS